MACFDFGPRRKVQNRNGKEVEVGDYALHVECTWRIRRGDRIVVGRQDLYYPAEFDETKPIPENFDWEHDPNLHDKLLGSLFENGTREFMVTGVEVGAAGGFNIEIGENLFLEIFPSNSMSDEHWRLFEPRRDKPHFVVTGDGIKD